MHQFFQRIGQSAKKFFRLFGSVLRHFAPRTFFRHVKNLFGILRQKGFRGLAAQIRNFNTNMRRENSAADPLVLTPGCRVGIIATRHTRFVAQLCAHQLTQAGFCPQIFVDDEALPYEDIPYLIICPQFLRSFPKQYAVFQMEQTVSSRWLTRDYIQILKNANAVFDYSLVNVDYFRRYADIAKKTYYLPIDFCPDLTRNTESTAQKEYDVLFYGDVNDRRQAILDELSKEFRIRVVREVFGEPLYEQLRRARLVLNLHYYEGALLETTRLYEVLSVSDALIVSERSADPNEETRLEGIADFCPVGDVAALRERIGYWLSHESERQEKAAQNARLLRERANAFSFYFDRFLLAQEAVGFDDFYKRNGAFIHFNGERVCLSLAETTGRRANFDRDNRFGFEVFPGLRHTTGWIGCALSYCFLMRKAAEQGLPRLIVCEDDTQFPADFAQRLDRVLARLDREDDWDIFCGLVANSDGIEVTGVEHDGAQRYIRLSRMMSMVCNVYSQSAYPYFAHWDPHAADESVRTIDGFLASQNLRILSVLPFLCGHKPEEVSTVWGGSNSDRYSDIIERSAAHLTLQADAFDAD